MTMFFRYYLKCYRVRGLILFSGLWAFFVNPGTVVADSEIKLLTIGNSFADNATRYLEELGASNGISIQVSKANLGGSSLERHARHLAAFLKDPNDPEGRPYRNRNQPDEPPFSLIEALEADDWDFVSIQQLSADSYKPDTYEPYASQLIGAIQHMPRIVPGLADVQAKAAEAGEAASAKALAAGQSVEAAQRAAGIASRLKEQDITASVTKVQEIGGLLGRVVLVLLIVRIVSRRSVIRCFLIPGVVVMPLVFAGALTSNLTLSYIGMFSAALLTVGMFSFWGNYLPRVYPVHLRGTGESFAANIGGRMIGTSFAWVTSTLATAAWMPGSTAPDKLAYTAAIIGFLVFAGGFVASYFLPEPPEEALPD
jgi:hypothetical protein